jgi:hypothetical protein
LRSQEGHGETVLNSSYHGNSHFSQYQIMNNNESLCGTIPLLTWCKVFHNKPLEAEEYRNSNSLEKMRSQVCEAKRIGK